MKRKVLIRINSLRPGGAERVLMTILKHLDYAKFEVTLLVNRKGFALDDEVPSMVKTRFLFIGSSLLKNNIRDTIYKLYRELALGMINLFPQVLYWLRVIDGQNVEVAFWEDIVPDISRSRLKESTKIAWIHSDIKFNKTLSARKKRQICQSLIQFDKIIVVSELALESLLEFCLELNISTDLIRNRISIIHNPIDADEIIGRSNTKLSIENGDQHLTLVSVGSLSVNKGFERLINVHKRLIDEGIKHRLWIAGTGSMENELVTQIEELGIADSVNLLGFQANPYPFMKHADIFVLPSYTEGFSLVLAESMILGKPIVSTQNAGANEVLKMGEYGMLVENSEDGICDGIKKLLVNEALRKEYAEKSKTGSRQFELSRVMQKIETVLIDSA